MDFPGEFRIIDLLDILLVALIIFQLYQLIKGTAGIRIFIGILAIYLLWKFVSLLRMEMLSEILGQFIGVGVIALLIVFQQELRQFLLFIGNRGWIRGSSGKNPFRGIFKDAKDAKSDAGSIIKACVRMAKSRTGALIVMARESDPEPLIKSGLVLDAQLSSSLLESVFFKNSPLHDGAVLIKDNRIRLARGVLPVSDSEDLDPGLGMRHRAALGLSEQTDALIIIVSEQTGEIAIARSGIIESKVDQERLETLLRE